MFTWNKASLVPRVARTLDLSCLRRLGSEAQSVTMERERGREREREGERRKRESVVGVVGNWSIGKGNRKHVEVSRLQNPDNAPFRP